jgi:hypothetical protein
MCVCVEMYLCVCSMWRSSHGGVFMCVFVCIVVEGVLHVHVCARLHVLCVVVGLLM